MKKNLLFVICVLLYWSCSNNKTSSNMTNEDYKTGKIYISVDKSFEPVIKEILQVFHSSYPDATIIPQYKSEEDCLKDLDVDSVRMVLVTRPLSEQEEKIMTDKLRFKPRYHHVVFDAIAVITHPSQKDVMFKKQDIIDMLKGKNKKYNIAIESKKNSSVLRYFLDSMVALKDLSPKVYGLDSPIALINYVSKTPNAVGLLGVSWVGNLDDPKQISFTNKVNVSYLECLTCKEKDIFVRPYQINIAHNKYPFIRKLYYILKENYSGLGSGLVNFMSYERGQLIFKRFYLMPSRMNFQVRNVKLN